MQLKNPLSGGKAHRNERAVSPVIGVILMVAITVILAAVIGVFVMGLGDELGDSTAPTATIGFADGEHGVYNFSIEHQSGDTLELNDNDYSILLDGTAVEVDDWDYEESADERSLSAGESIDILVEENPNYGETDVQLRHEDSNSIISQGTVNVSIAHAG